MQAILKKQIRDFSSEVKIALKIVQKSEPALELFSFKQWLLDYYNRLLNSLIVIEYHVSLGEGSIYADVYSMTAKLEREFRLVNAKFMPALYRHHYKDKMVLRMLSWLHNQHIQTKNKPFAVQDADFAIFPTIDLPLIYFLPITSQHTLLHLPLFFHEVGHYFFEYHQKKMITIIEELQNRLEEYLIIPFQQNDERYNFEKKKNDLIVETWFDWMIELFCDAVGLHIGGPAYLHSFSNYLLPKGGESFFVPERYLPKSKHPVTWIRIKILAHLATQWGLEKESDNLIEEWQKVAKTLKIRENYFGYFSDEYLGDVLQTLLLMLEEVKPVNFANYQYLSEDLNMFRPNYIQLVNLAWRKYKDESEDYFEWEESIIEYSMVDHEKEVGLDIPRQ